MSEDREDIAALFDLRDEGQGAFTGAAATSGAFRIRVFGGQLLAQALAAASFTVPSDVPAHSLHAYFARPGIPARPIGYEVTAMRDGSSYLMRSVAAVQRDELICHVIASFGPDHEGPEYQPPMPDTPMPETFPPEAERMAQLLSRVDPARRSFLQGSPVETISVDWADPTDRSVSRGPVRNWIRLRQPIPSDPILQRCVLVYCSDMGLLAPSVRSIGASFMDPEFQIASLDHALWFHRPFTWDDWLLFVAESLSVSGGRGLNRGSVYTRSGQLVASVAQEAMVRRRNILPDG
jgi:acyl-CoA thioesterase-2